MTPDSFSDGGRYSNVGAAVQRGLEMAREGADIIDVGGESSGPDSKFVPEKEELRRVIPVIKKLAELLSRNFKDKSVPLISIDTYKAEVAAQAIQAGAKMINDVTAMRDDPKMAVVAAQTGVKIILMYSKDPTARTTRTKKHYKDVIKTVKKFLSERIEFAQKSGIKRKNIIIDPGMGAFLSGIPKYNFEVLNRLKELKKLGCLILIGASRKSFLPGAVSERLEATLVANLIAILNGANFIRVHDVAPHRRTIETLATFKKFSKIH